VAVRGGVRCYRPMHLEDGASIQLYLRSIRAIPLLSLEEERRLARVYRRTGDADTAHRLVTANLRFVVLLARRAMLHGGRLADLIQEGNIGLMEAVKRFDPEKNVRLVSYASWWIRAYIRDHLLRSSSLVRVGTAESARSRLGDVSLDAPADDGAASIHELATDEEASPETGLARAQEDKALQRRVASALSRLDVRERFLVNAHLMRDDPMTLREVGNHFGCSAQRAQQLHNRAREKLRGHLEASEATAKTG
jgi:RNA polymerase sigma-32 factor